ncbi:MAG: 3-phosphoglycerate dehydrogenase family protein [Oscillospiraceae bacterium]|nr:3-phosphoglycerate dehydrogenase family protein [Oscillospiraceae bacterium]
MYNIKILNNITSAALDKLDKEKYFVSTEVENPDAIIVRSTSLHDAVFNPGLLCIARAGAGVNNIPIDRCADEGIIVFNTPGANADAVKELVLCTMLLSSRDIIGGIDWVKSTAAEGGDIAALVEKEKARFVGPEVFGKTLGVIGLGAIGAKIAQAASVLGMQVYGYDPYLSVEAAWKLSSDIIHASDLDMIYKNSDYITIHVPYLESTHHFINKESIEKMKPGVRLINLARAELVCDDDMLEALASGQVTCYATDFPTAKTAGAPGVIATPHLGASTPESEDNCVTMACSEIVEYIENGNILNSVNMPYSFLPRTSDPRICVIHDNVPEMISKITGAVSSFGVNIENMINSGTKGRLPSYTMLDVSALPDGVGDAIMSISGVTMVRTLPGPG